VRSWCVKVPKVEGESARKKLLEMGLLDISLAIRYQEGDLLLPVIDTDSLESMGPTLEDFEEREIHETDYRLLADVPEVLKDLLPTSFDVVGDIAILRLKDELVPYAGKIGDSLRRVLPRLRTVALDRGVQGEFRVREVEVVSGNPSPVTIHTEFGLRFRVDVSKVYFNPRLANERRRVSSLVREGEEVIDMFAGAGPFSIMIAKYALPGRVHAIDLNPAAVELMRDNIALNRVDGITPLLGDAREIIPGLPQADRIIMNLPHSAHGFLEDAVMSLKHGGTVHLYSICERSDVDGFVEGLISKLREVGIDLEVVRLEELKTYSPTTSIYSMDLVLTHRSSSTVRG